MTEMPDHDDPDRAEWEALRWLRDEQRVDVGEQMRRLLARRAKRDAEARELAERAGIVRDPGFRLGNVTTEDPDTQEARHRRFTDAEAAKLRVDVAAGLTTGGRLDHSRPAGSNPYLPPDLA